MLKNEAGIPPLSFIDNLRLGSPSNAMITSTSLKFAEIGRRTPIAFFVYDAGTKEYPFV